MKDTASVNAFSEYEINIGDAAFTVVIDKGSICNAPSRKRHLHSHLYNELFFVKQGSIIINMQDKFIELEEGDMAVIPAKVMHCSYNENQAYRVALSFQVKELKRKELNYFGVFCDLLGNSDITVFRKFIGANTIERFMNYY